MSLASQAQSQSPSWLCSGSGCLRADEPAAQRNGASQKPPQMDGRSLGPPVQRSSRLREEHCVWALQEEEMGRGWGTTHGKRPPGNQRRGAGSSAEPTSGGGEDQEPGGNTRGRGLPLPRILEDTHTGFPMTLAWWTGTQMTWNGPWGRWES